MITASSNTSADVRQPVSTEAQPIAPASSGAPAPERIREHLRHQLAAGIASQMAFKDLLPTDSPGRQISLFSRGINDLADAHGVLQRLCNDAVNTNIFVETDKENHNHEEALRAEAFQKMKGHMPAWDYSTPDVLDWQLGDMSDRELYHFLRKFLWKQTNVLCGGFADHLQEMVDCNLFGLHQWHPTASGWGRYHFFRVRVMRKQTQVKTKRDRQRTEYRDRNLFEIVEKVETVSMHDQTLILERHDHRSKVLAMGNRGRNCCSWRQ